MRDFKPRDDGIPCDSSKPVRTRSRDVTRGNGVARLAGGLWRTVLGALIGRRGCSVTCRGARILKRDCALRSECGGRAEMTRVCTGIKSRTLEPYDEWRQSRERPSLPETDLKAENARTF